MKDATDKAYFYCDFQRILFVICLFCLISSIRAQFSALLGARLSWRGRVSVARLALSHFAELQRLPCRPFDVLNAIFAADRRHIIFF